MGIKGHLSAWPRPGHLSPGGLGAFQSCHVRTAATWDSALEGAGVVHDGS